MAIEGTLVKFDGFPHCTNCAAWGEKKEGWFCGAWRTWDKSAQPETISMSWDWGLWRGDVFLGFVKQWGCMSYEPREMDLTEKEYEWTDMVQLLDRLGDACDKRPENTGLSDAYNSADNLVYKLMKELRNGRP